MYETIKPRKLEMQEHGRTRTLWERVFQEDTKAFLDYYYFFKARENEIYVMEEDDEVRSMLQLNPYILQVEEERFTGHYIIAVATEEPYRKRGYMGALLRRAMQDMYKRKELFTFLMPAAEKIYLPYDFRFVYAQNVWKYQVSEEISEGDGWGREFTVSEAGIGDGELLAEFFNTYFAKRFQVYAVRGSGYYQTMLFEQQSEKGGIRLLKKGDKIIGSFLYGDEDGLEIREPLYLEEYEPEFLEALRQLCVERKQKQATVYADCKGEKKPMVMVRILHLENLLKLLKTQKGETVDCSFAVLDSILPQNSRVWRIRSKELLQTEEEKDAENGSGDLSVRETEDSEGALTIAALTSLVFGYKSAEEIREEPDVVMTERLMTELKKLEPLQKIYLNEIV